MKSRSKWRDSSVNRESKKPDSRNREFLPKERPRSLLIMLKSRSKDREEKLPLRILVLRFKQE